jgi:hypothetical protein
MDMEILTFRDIFLVTIFFVCYFLPSFIAMLRDHKNKLAILLLNILLGWTIRGWVVALIWSVAK